VKKKKKIQNIHTSFGSKLHPCLKWGLS